MPKSNLSNVFEPITVNGVTLRNRVVMPPMGTGFGSEDHKVTDQTIAYLSRRSEGGAGLIIVEFTAVDPGGLCEARQLGIYDDGQMPGFRRLTEAIHQYGAKIALQIHHGGAKAELEYSGGVNVAPSAIPDPRVGVLPHALTVEEIQDIIAAFGSAAHRAKDAGFDAVEIHGAHGYLVNQFLSPWYNRREDEYGGTLESRLRLAVEVVRHIRGIVGPDFLVGFRMVGEEMPPGTGLTIKESARIAPLLEQAGVDWLHVSVGDVTNSLSMIEAPMAVDPGFNVYAASKIKREVNIPVITVGRINDIHLADQIVEQGHADLVAMGRAHLADPEFVRKAAEGRFAEIRKCFGCGDACSSGPIGCNNNPELGRESWWDESKAATSKTVWVIGGGVGGLEAATLAARRGHLVTLFEKEATLGGQIESAAAPPHKRDLLNAISSRVALLTKHGVEVRLATEVTAAMVRESKPDTVVIATGSVTRQLPVSGVNQSDVIDARDVLTGQAFVGPRVAVLGGGLVGCETAEYLADRRRQVTIIEMLDDIAMDMPRIPRAYLLDRLRQYEVRILTGTRVESITEHGILVEAAGHRRIINGFSTIVFATGSTPTDQLFQELAGLIDDLHVIGDAKQIGRIVDATAQGAEVALGI